MKVSDAILAFCVNLEVSVSPGSLKHYKLMLKSFALTLPDEIQVREVNTEMVAAHLRDMHKAGRKGSYIAQSRDTIFAMFNWCVDNRIVRRNPVEKKKLPKIVVVPPSKLCIHEEQHRAIMVFLRNEKKSGRLDGRGMWMLICELAYRTSLRLSDIFTLKWESVDFENRVLRVTPIKTKRLNKRVVIPMDDEVFRMLSEHRKKPYKNYGESPFVMPEAEWRYTEAYDGIRASFRCIAIHCGIGAKYSFHCYRHGLVSRMANGGISPLIISSITGHSLAQIQTYVHVSEDIQRAALNQANGGKIVGSIFKKPIAVQPIQQST